MSVIRIKKARNKPYVILDTTALNDARLSFRAKGLHTYLMSKPDNWRINADHLAQQSPKEGREAINAAMRELRETGYARRTRTRDAQGHVLGSDTTVYETPQLALEDEADEDLATCTIGLTDPEPDDHRQTGFPKIGSTESRLLRKSASPKVGKPVPVVSIEKAVNIEKDSLSSTDVDEPRPPPVDNSPKLPTTQEFVECWEAICVTYGHLPSKRILSEKLKAKIRLRLKEHPDDAFWNTVFNKCVDSPFLSGKKTSWKVTLDWLVANGDNAIKVYEGHYDGP